MRNSFSTQCGRARNSNQSTILSCCFCWGDWRNAPQNATLLSGRNCLTRRWACQDAEICACPQHWIAPATVVTFRDVCRAATYRKKHSSFVRLTLRLALSGVPPPRLQPQVAAHVAAFAETMRIILQRQQEGHRRGSFTAWWASPESRKFWGGTAVALRLCCFRLQFHIQRQEGD